MDKRHKSKLIAVNSHAPLRRGDALEVPVMWAMIEASFGFEYGGMMTYALAVTCQKPAVWPGGGGSYIYDGVTFNDLRVTDAGEI